MWGASEVRNLGVAEIGFADSDSSTSPSSAYLLPWSDTQLILRRSVTIFLRVERNSTWYNATNNTFLHCITKSAISRQHYGDQYSISLPTRRSRGVIVVDKI
jgi:hypothetical protein